MVLTFGRVIKQVDTNDQSQHLFCVDGKRCKTVLDCFQILGYDGADAVPWQNVLKEKLDAQLGGCTNCVVHYYRAKQNLVRELREAYDEEEVENFIHLLNETDNTRIIRGLKNAKDTLEKLPDAERRVTALQLSDVLAIFEALTSESFLTQEVLLKDYFNEPFKLVQTHKPLLVQYYIPALTQFLFADFGQNAKWASNNWVKLENGKKDKPKNRIGDMTRSDFEFAVRRPLTRVMERLIDQLNNNWIAETGPKRLERFWRGVDLIVDRMDTDTITHGLRAMDVSIYRFLLDWLHYVNQQALLYLLSAVRGLLSKGPKEFWDALGAVSSKSVVEGIFSSPSFLPTLASVQQVAGNNDLALLLGWIEPFMASLQIAQKSEATQTMVEHLMSKFQTANNSNEVRAECYRIGLKVLVTSLTECSEPGFNFNGVGKVVASNILGVAARYINDIVSPLDVHTIAATGPTEIVSLCKDSLKLALKLECDSLYRERHEIHNSEKLDATFRVSQLRIWPAVCSVFDDTKTELAPICIEAITHFVALEKFESKITLERQKQRQDFNSMLDIACGYVDKILQTLVRFSAADLAKLSQDPTVAADLIKTLFLSNEDNYGSALSLIKSVSGASFRREAIGYFIEQSFDQTISGLSWVCIRIVKAKAFYSTSRLLKIMKNTLNMLCDDQDGVLKSRTLNTQSKQILEQFWTKQWDVVRITYLETAGWSTHHRIAIMQDFCRDVMDYSEILFDQFASIESAIENAHCDTNTEKPTNGGEASHTEFSILEAPSLSMKAVAGYLKLRDSYLLTKCVTLTWKLLTELTKRKIQLSERVSEYLKSMLVFESDIKTNLTEVQKAEIRRLLEDNLGHPLETPEERSRAAEISEISKVRLHAGKQAMLDVSSWTTKSKEGSKMDPTHPIRQTVPKSSIKQSISGMAIRQSKPDLVQSKAVAEAERSSFLKKREEARQEKKRRDAEAAAKARKNLPNTIANLTAGEGSALGNLGNLSREQIKQASDIMVDSGSEEDSDEDQWVDQLFGETHKSSAAVNAYNANRRAQAQRPQRPVKKIKQVRTKKDLRARVAPDLSPIHEIMLKWNFFHDGDLPPTSNRDNYSLITSTFNTAQEYRKTFEPLLLLEAWQSFRQAREENNEKVFAIKIVNRMNQDNLVVISATLELSSPSDKPPFEGDILLLSKSSTPSKDSKSPSCMARVFKINRRPQAVEISMRVARGNSLLDALMPNISLNSEKVNSIIPLEREYGALLGLEYYDLCDEIVRAYPSPIMNYNDNVLNKVMTSYNLNKAQAKALKSSVDNDGFTLIQGPPGSGKTKTIVAIVGALLSDVLVENKAIAINIPTPIGDGGQDRIVPKKLLVCAPSNAAVDELVMRFMHGIKTVQGNIQKPSVVRLGKSESINAKVMDVTLDELVSQRLNQIAPTQDKGQTETHMTMMEHKATCDEINAAHAQMGEFKAKGQSMNPEFYHKLDVLQRKKQQLGNRIDKLKDDGNTSARNAEIMRNKIRQEIVDGAHILCATLSGSGHDMFRNLSLDFDTVIIDEAAQSIELSALIPLKYGCSKCIMVGDPKQLPPTVLSREASRFQYEQSLFVRMQANSPDNVHLLDTQYRMHPEISSFPSSTFYDGKLLDGPDMAKLTAKPWHADPLLGPFRFFDVQGMHQSGPVGHSLINRAEVNIAVKLFKRLKDCAYGYDFYGRVGVITPYKSQLKELRNTFSNHFGSDITKAIDFNTTDAFQGRESEIIIFSCVRASGNGIGFLSDIRRMNVGITRAKSSLWVLGNSENLMQGEYWSKLIVNAKARKRFTTNVDAAIAQAVNRVKIEDETSFKKDPALAQVLVESKDVDMPDAPTRNPKSLSRQEKSVENLPRLNINNSKKRSYSPSSPPGHPNKSTKTQAKVIDDTPSRNKNKADTDGLQPRTSGNSNLKSKPATVHSAASAPRPSGDRNVNPPEIASHARPVIRPGQRPLQAKKNPAELAFIKRKPPRGNR